MSKLDETCFDFQAKIERMSPESQDQVIIIKCKEIKERASTLAETQSKAKSAVSHVKFYLKDVSQKKQVAFLLWALRSQTICTPHICQHSGASSRWSS